MARFYFSLFSFLTLLPTKGFSCVRVDLEDRSPTAVLAKAHSLAKITGPAKAIGSIRVGEEISSAIALDPYTVLTTAHIKGLAGASAITFKLTENALKPAAGEGEYCETTPHKAIIHPDFKRHDVGDDVIALSSNGCAVNGVHQGAAEGLTFAQHLSMEHPFSGVDLAIVKLSKPLPDSIVFPEILDPEEPISDEYGIAFGYGPMRYNTQDQGPQIAATSLEGSLQRHLISTKVSVHHGAGVHYLHGSYKGLLVNGDESFIADSSMMKTEGLPVMGDSGGALCLQKDASYQLAGILSATYATNSQPLEDPRLQHVLGTTEQSLFPAWIDVRQYIEWIRENMGEPK